jgi:5-methylcytosine-specific restriction protein A
LGAHRRPVIRFSDAPRGTCRWCGEAIVYLGGAKQGKPDRRRRWHPECVDAYNATDPRELRRRVRRRDRGQCAVCRLDTYALKRRMKGRGMWSKLCEKGFVRRRSLWELDHIVPLIEAGSHDLSNLQTLCVPCHRKKTACESRQRAIRRTTQRAQAAGGGSTPAGEVGESAISVSDDLDRELERLLARVDEANARIAATLATESPNALEWNLQSGFDGNE